MAHQLFVALLRDADSFPAGRRGSILAEQLLRSAGSIGANIAEGFSRSRRKFANSLDIALGEANEAESWLYKARDAGWLTEEAAAERLRTVVVLEKMLSSLKAAIAANDGAVREPEGEYRLEQVDDVS
jgi:four helix bundle protein